MRGGFTATRRAFALALVAAGAVAAPVLAAGSPATERVSVSSAGTEADSFSETSVLSTDGNIVAFDSNADNLVPLDTNHQVDVFVRNRAGHATTRVSLSSTGAQANGQSSEPAVSGDGHLVAFTSSATNLVPHDTNNSGDIFVRDLRTKKTTRISVSSSGRQANEGSDLPTMSRDGRYVAFASGASNLVRGDTNALVDVFVRDLKKGTTTRASVSSSGAEGDDLSLFPSISGNGRMVAWESRAQTFVPRDGNGRSDVFVRDLMTHVTRRVSVSSSGAEGNGDSFTPSLSFDGHIVAFQSGSTNFARPGPVAAQNIFVRDTRAKTTRLVSATPAGVPGDGESFFVDPSISGDGRFIVFSSFAKDLVAGDTNGAIDDFVRDTVKRTTQRISVSSTGVQGDANSLDAAISGDGRWAAFWSTAKTLVPNDMNATSDVFVRGPLAP